MNAIASINPATGELIRSYLEHPDSELESALIQADLAFRGWRRSAFPARASVMQASAVLLRSQTEMYARLMAQEMGKPLAQGRSEIEKCAGVCDYFAQNAQRFLSPELVPTDATKSFIAFEPLGVILAIMPWNFPFWQVFRAAVPAIMAGNAIILKHASNVPGCALAIEQLLKEAGLPEGLFRALLIGSGRVGGLIEHPAVKAVTLTGGASAGKAVSAKAGAMLKKTVLELGGSDPYIVLEDSDLEPTVETCATARLINSGQSCVAAKRFIVVEKVRKAFEKRMVELMRDRARTMGDPLKEDTALGPLARHDLRDTVHQQVQESVSQGARLLLGGQIPKSKGAFYPPTVLTDVRKGMPAFDEETFGPAAAIVSAKDEAEAIRLANDSRFGLGAAIFTRDCARAERLASELEVGLCFINAFVRSDPRLPFGGIKHSGYGRELSVFGLREFVNIKTVYVK